MRKDILLLELIIGMTFLALGATYFWLEEVPPVLVKYGIAILFACNGVVLILEGLIALATRKEEGV